MFSGDWHFRVVCLVQHVVCVFNVSVRLGHCLRTVAVVPVLPELGMIAWARDTCTLKSVVLEMCGRSKELHEIEAHKMYGEWVRLYGAQVEVRYQKVFCLQRADVVVAFKRCVGKLTEDMSLRSWLFRRALGPEAGLTFGTGSKHWESRAGAGVFLHVLCRFG